jgi:cytidylate kinase
VGTRVAAALGLPFIDTGAMYRAVTWLALRRGVPVDDPAALATLVRSVSIAVAAPPPGSQEAAVIRVDGLDAGPHLRDPDVERAVSLVSAVPAVREVMVQLQRQAVRGQVVMAGRDIGTVVLPDADLKVYLDASPEVRARRRMAELAHRGTAADYAAVLADLRQRDALDSTRAVAPLRPADDAVVIHTDPLTVDEVVARVLALVREREQARPRTDLPSAQGMRDEGCGDR